MFDNTHFATNAAKTNRFLNRTFTQLSTGKTLEIAHQIIGENLATQSSHLDIRATNGELHSARLSTQATGLSKQSEIVGRLGQLALRASSGLLNSADRGALDAEAQQLKAELSSVGDFKFNGQAILEGDTIQAKIGTDFEITDVDGVAIADSLANIDLSTQAGAQAAMGDIDTAMGSIAQGMAQVGSFASRVERSTEIARETSANLAQASAVTMGVDIAKSLAQVTAGQLMQSVQTSTQLLHQSILAKNTRKFFE